MGHGRHWVDSKSLRTKNEFLHYFASMKQEVNAMCMVWLGGPGGGVVDLLFTQLSINMNCVQCL